MKKLHKAKHYTSFSKISNHRIDIHKKTEHFGIQLINGHCFNKLLCLQYKKLQDFHE